MRKVVYVTPTKESPTRFCRVCGDAFEPVNKTQRVCSRDCQKEEGRLKSPKGLGHGLGLPTGTIGAFGELTVAVDLIRRGYHVFRALAPHSPCDLIAFRSNERPLKVEVTAGTRLVSGRVAYPSKSPSYEFDVLALVFHDGEIIYLPGRQQVDDEHTGSLDALFDLQTHRSAAHGTDEANDEEPRRENIRAWGFGP